MRPPRVAIVRPAIVRPAIVRAAVAWAVVAACVLGDPGSAGAGGGAGASGSGDEIISSILSATSAGPGRSPGTAPRCRWHNLSDEQVVFLIHVAASRPELLTAAFLERIQEYANLAVVAHGSPGTPPATDVPLVPDVPLVTEVASVTYWQLMVRVCDGVADTMSVRSRSVTNPLAMVPTVARGAVRQSTLLPPPAVTISPPPRGGRVPRTVVGEPVFFSARPPAAVRHNLSFGGRTVEVTAEPTGLELFSGEPGDAGDTVDCDGFGVRYDPHADSSPSRQARAPGACVLLFDQSTGGGRRDAWLGYVRMNWRGSYRVDGGAAVPLDGLFSLTIVSIAVDEIDTAIGRRSPD